MRDYSWAVVCDSDYCHPAGFHGREAARAYAKQHGWVNQHTTEIKPAAEVTFDDAR